jgi:hypothetical protein
MWFVFVSRPTILNLALSAKETTSQYICRYQGLTPSTQEVRRHSLCIFLLPLLIYELHNRSVNPKWIGTPQTQIVWATGKQTQYCVIMFEKNKRQHNHIKHRTCVYGYLNTQRFTEIPLLTSISWLIVFSSSLLQPGFQARSYTSRHLQFHTLSSFSDELLWTGVTAAVDKVTRRGFITVVLFLVLCSRLPSQVMKLEAAAQKWTLAKNCRHEIWLDTEKRRLALVKVNLPILLMKHSSGSYIKTRHSDGRWHISNRLLALASLNNIAWQWNLQHIQRTLWGRLHERQPIHTDSCFVVTKHLISSFYKFYCFN